jgi:hypothetical protein
MATNQLKRIGVLEGDIYIYGRASEAMEAGDVVAIDTTSGYPYFCKCTSAMYPFGIVAQQVTAAGVADYEPGGLVSQTAKVGDRVGVYIDGGLYHHGATGIAYGDLLFVNGGTAGKMTSGAVTTAAASQKICGVCVRATDTNGNTLFKSLL